MDKTERQPQMLYKELLKNWEEIDELPDVTLPVLATG